MSPGGARALARQPPRGREGEFRGMKMRILALSVALASILASILASTLPSTLASPASAQTPPPKAPTPALPPPSLQAPAAALPLGKLEIKAYEKIAKSKVAVQLSSETELGRHLRGKVMASLAKRGNEVGFSGGNVMRMDVTYLDLSGGGYDGNATIGGQPSYASPGSNPRPEMPANRFAPRDRIDAKSAPTLRLTLTLYAVENGKVLWAASSSCGIYGDVQRVGELMIEAIFGDADKSRTADAGCPL